MTLSMTALRLCSAGRAQPCIWRRRIYQYHAICAREAAADLRVLVRGFHVAFRAPLSAKIARLFPVFIGNCFLSAAHPDDTGRDTGMVQARRQSAGKPAPSPKVDPPVRRAPPSLSRGRLTPDLRLLRTATRSALIRFRHCWTR